MKVVLVASVPFPPEEGLGNYVWNLARRAAQAGHDAHVYTRGAGPKREAETREGVTLHRVPASRLYPVHVHLHARHLQRALDEEAADADVVHFHTPLPAPVRVRAPTLLTFHTPVLANFRALTTWDVTSVLYRLQTPVSYAVERQLIRRADLVTAVSPSVAGQLASYGLRREDVVVLENGVDPHVFTPPAAPRGDYLLYTGRLGWRKGLFELVAAMAELRRQGVEKRLVVTGKGPFRAKLEAEAARRGVKDLVEFAGFVERERLIRLLQGAEAFVFPSHYEGLPTSVLEAMSTATPIVTTDAPGVVDLVEHERNGLAVPVGDAAGLARAIARMHADPGLRRRLGEAARKDVEQRYAWERIAEKAFGLYRSLARERRDARRPRGRAAP